MNNRDESINDGVSKLCNDLFALKVLRGLQGDLASIKEAQHGLIEVALEIALYGKTDVSNGNHGMKFCLCRVVGVREHSVKAVHKVAGIVFHVAL